MLPTAIEHIAIAVDDLEAAIDDAPRPGSRGTTVALDHPKGNCATLTELVQE